MISLGILELIFTNTILCGFDTHTCTTTLLQNDSCNWRVLIFYTTKFWRRCPGISCFVGIDFMLRLILSCYQLFWQFYFSILLVSCFFIQKNFYKKKIRIGLFACFGCLFKFWKIGFCQYDRAHCRTCAHQCRQRALKDSSQCNVAIDRISIAIERFSSLPYISLDPDRGLSVSLVTRAQCALRSITPLLQSTALAADCHILSLCLIARYLRLSASPQLAPIDLKQLSFNF